MSNASMRNATVLAILLLFPAFSIAPGLVGTASGAAPSPTPFYTPVVVNDYILGDQGLPVIASLPNKRLIILWQDPRSGLEDIYASVSNNNGTTYDPNKRVDDSFGSSRQVEPSVAVTANGTILAVWQDNRRSTIDYDIYFSRSLNGGATFTKNVKVDDSNSTISWQERPSVAVTSKGLIYVAWTDDRTGHLRIRGAYSADGGATFSPSSEIVSTSSTSGQTGGGVAATDNRVFIAFMDNVSGAPHPYACISTDGGKNFSSPVRLDDTGESGAMQRGLAIAPMPDGGVAAVWEDSRNGGWDLYASIVTRNGALTGPNFRVDDDTSGAYQKNANIATDQIGNIYAVWEDERDNNFAVRFAYAEQGIDQFSASVEIASPGPNDVQRRPAIAAVEPGQVFVTWQDDKEGTYDVYSCAGYIPNLFSMHLESSWNFVSIYLEGFSYNASTLGLAFGDVVVAWNPATQSFDRTYIVGISASTFDFPIIPNSGYWIYAGVDEKLILKGHVPTSRQTKEISVPSGGGWAIFSFASLNITRYASDIPKLYSVPGSITCVVSYDTATGTYTGYISGLPHTDYALVPGKAYWSWVTASGVFSYDP